MIIRFARFDELERLREIEREAGVAFRELGMDLVANDDPPSIDILAEYQIDDRAWVCIDESRDNLVVGYAIGKKVDRCGHLEQVSIDPAYSRRGIGRTLIDAVGQWSQRKGFDCLTLTTFTTVPWNGPYYQRCGFRYLTNEELTPGLIEIRAHEATIGLDTWPRACMRRNHASS